MLHLIPSNCITYWGGKKDDEDDSEEFCAIATRFGEEIDKLVAKWRSRIENVIDLTFRNTKDI